MKGGKIGCIALLIFLVSILILGTYLSNKNKSEEISTRTPKTQQEILQGIRDQQIAKNFSTWDGSLPALTALIKETMNDPDSYKHVKTIYWDKDDYLIVKTTFRGKNGFGGVVTNSLIAKADLNGNVIEILSSGP